MNTIKDLRNALREHMKSEGKTIRDIARACGVDESRLSRFLRTENPVGFSGEYTLRVLNFLTSIKHDKEKGRDTVF